MSVIELRKVTFWKQGSLAKYILSYRS